MGSFIPDLFLWNLVVSRYFKFSISEWDPCESLAKPYTRQMGSTGDQDTILCMFWGNLSDPSRRFSRGLENPRDIEQTLAFCSLWCPSTQNIAGNKEQVKRTFLLPHFLWKSQSPLQGNFSISNLQFQLQATETDIRSKMMKPSLFLESSAQHIYLYTVKYFHKLNLGSCQNKWTKYGLWCFILYLFIFCIVCSSVC